MCAKRFWDFDEIRQNKQCAMDRQSRVVTRLDPLTWNRSISDHKYRKKPANFAYITMG